MRSLFLASLWIAASFALAPVAVADGTCPDETTRQEMNGLTFCIPQSNARYQFTSKGVGPMYWRGDEPVEPPANPSEDEDLTIARVWADQGMVGLSDQASGTKGFDRFLDLIATSILKASQQADGEGAFRADVPIDESGRLQPFRFQRLESGILRGVRQDLDQAGNYMILMRPTETGGPPHLMLCGVVGAGGNPSHLCMSFVALNDRRMAITVAGRNLDRSFRISEGVKNDLVGFLVSPAAP